MQHAIQRFSCAAALLTCALSQAAGLKLMNDDALSNEVGHGGISFAASLNVSMNSNLGVYDPRGIKAFLRHDNFLTTGTFLLTFDIRQGEAGQSDFADWQIPNITTTKPLQMGYDLVIDANDKSFGTHVQLQDIVLAGSSAQVITGTTGGGGLTYGISLNKSIGQILLSPNGPTSTEGQMVISGVKVGGTTEGTPWVMADLKTQPGTFRVIGDGNGNSNFQFGIGWPTGTTEAATGRMSIDKVAFMDPSGVPTTNLGSSSIGSMQIQYLNIKIR